ncbi:MAG TPA: PIG-L family deacetylase [Caldilineaceae bacterium]|nr:PIG-L family deacetylase [Caldilineaceae bacterium]
MLRLLLDKRDDSPKRIVCLGAHSDDIEIGCGGTILRLTEANPNLEIHWVVLSAQGTRAEEARASAYDFLRKAGRAEVYIKQFQDGFFPYCGGDIKGFFEELKATVEPDIIFTHCRHDLHQDHRTMAELTWNTFRDHLVLEYEIPKYDGDLQSPNFFVHLASQICQQKIDYLMQHFATQANRHWFTPETFQAVMRLRGIESRAPEGYAEGFYCRKVVV